MVTEPQSWHLLAGTNTVRTTKQELGPVEGGAIQRKLKPQWRFITALEIPAKVVYEGKILWFISSFCPLVYSNASNLDRPKWKPEGKQ